MKMRFTPQARSSSHEFFLCFIYIQKLKMKEYRGYYYTYPTPNGDDDDCGDDSVSSPKMSMMRSMSMSRGKKQDYYPKTEGYFICT